MCNADLVFINIVARWPGSCHDSRILRQSQVYEQFENDPKPLQGFILGDSGYPLRDWLLTPVLNPRTNKEENYNNRHRRARCTVERAIGIAKRRWSCLQKLRTAPERACDIIMACMILHNRARLLRLSDDFEDDDSDAEAAEVAVEPADNYNQAPAQEQMRIARGRAVRDALIQNYF